MLDLSLNLNTKCEENYISMQRVTVHVTVNVSVHEYFNG